MERDRGNGIKIDLHQAESSLAQHAKEIEKVLRHAVREALLMHKRADNPVAVWRDDKVVWLQPEDILIDDDGVEESA